MNIFGAIKTLFGFDGVSNTALKIVDKIAGTDWTPQQRADFILKHAEITKYQSPARRFIALAYMVEQGSLALVWLVSVTYARIALDSHALLLSHDIESFLRGNISMAMNGILAFYFLTAMKK